MRKLLGLLVTPVIATCLFSASTLAQVQLEEKEVQLDKGKHYVAGMREYGISGGFGIADNKRPVGDDSEFITDFVLLPKWGIILGDYDGVLPGAFELEIEGIAGAFLTPELASEGGLTLLFTYNFETGTDFVPFVSAGGGFLYTDLDTTDLGSRYNGSPQGGLGVKYFLDDKTALSVMGRIRHISNAGFSSSNRGINSAYLLFGINFLH